MKFLLNFQLLRALGFLFQMFPNVEHLDKGWQLGYNALRAIYEFVMHLKGARPTAAQVSDLLHDVQEQQAKDAAAESPDAVSAQAPPAGPVSDDTLAPRAIIEA